jgi:uncharacterized protein HemX
MCTGLEIALIAGTAVSGIGQIQASQAQSETLKRQAELGRRSAVFEEARLREESERVLGRQKTAAAKSGVTRSGSVFEVMRESAEQAELEALNIQFGAGAGSQARLFEAEQARTAGALQATGTFLSGARSFR